LIHLAEVDLRGGMLEEVRRNLMEGLRIVRDHGLRALALPSLRQSAELAAAAGDTARGVRWSAGAASLEHAMGSKGPLWRKRANATITARGREILGAREYARVATEGAALGYEEALAEVQAWLEDPERWGHRT
jgi:hypothetical protein